MSLFTVIPQGPFESKCRKQLSLSSCGTVPVKNERRTRRIHRTVKSSCRCSMTSHGDLKKMNRNVLLTPHLCLYLQKDFQQDVGHSSDLDQKRSDILLTTKDHKENGTESLN